DIPGQYYVSFARWNEMSLLRSPRTLRELRQLAATSLEPESLERFIQLLENNAGYALYRSVSAAKAELSSAENTELRFESDGVLIETPLRRETFETWIAEDLSRIGRAVDDLMAKAGLTPNHVDQVFLTGGTSFVPAVRRLFERRFGEGKLESGNQFDAIARGLALIGQESDIERWASGPPEVLP
ncbi:MAG: Hsp70 family protein, partial [Methylococcaceae bacterium]|nr:Hsp70 family protein [Methylococcaceae bacterium]